jgi:hypothetical protein
MNLSQQLIVWWLCQLLCLLSEFVWFEKVFKYLYAPANLLYFPFDQTKNQCSIFSQDVPQVSKPQDQTGELRLIRIGRPPRLRI